MAQRAVDDQYRKSQSELESRARGFRGRRDGRARFRRTRNRQNSSTRRSRAAHDEPVVQRDRELDRRSQVKDYSACKMGTFLPYAATLTEDHGPPAPRRPLLLRQTTLRLNPGPTTPNATWHPLPTLRNLRRSDRRLRPQAPGSLNTDDTD